MQRQSRTFAFWLWMTNSWNIRSVLQEILEAHGFEALTAVKTKRGCRGFLIRKRTKFDLVILDMRMPVMGGKEAFLEIKNAKMTKSDYYQRILRSVRNYRNWRYNEGVGLFSKPFQIEEDILKQVKSTLVH
ncbi:MAG: response regulator [Calditrichia bacterium]